MWHALVDGFGEVPDTAVALIVDTPRDLPIEATHETVRLVEAALEAGAPIVALGLTGIEGSRHESEFVHLREAADRCANFGQGVAERASVHPYGPEWCDGFAEAALGAAADIALYAAGEVVPPIDAEALRAARTTARYLSPLHALRAIRPEGSADSRGW